MVVLFENRFAFSHVPNEMLFFDLIVVALIVCASFIMFKWMVWIVWSVHEFVLKVKCHSS